MPAPHARFALAALLLAATGASAFAADTPAPSARALVDSLSARYASLSAYRISGVTTMDMTGAEGVEPMHAVAPFSFAAHWPSRLRNELQSPGMPLFVEADGESLMIIASGLGQYVVQAAPRLAAGMPVDPQLAGLLQPLNTVVQVGMGIANASDVGPDTVLTPSGPVTCRRVVVEYATASVRPGVKVLPRTLWIDTARGVLLLDSLTIEISQPGVPVRTSVQVTRFVDVDVADGGPDSLYRLPRPGDLKRVASFGPQAPPPPAITGKLAKDFTLSTLAGTKVKLSSLRGKVVVLDFWATWCGPCRRWMPIVAKLEKELRGKDVRFYAVNEHEEIEKVRAYLKTSGVTVPVLLDADGTVGDAYGASSIPLTAIVGRDGKVVHALLGVHPEKDLRDALKAAGVKGL